MVALMEIGGTTVFQEGKAILFQAGMAIDCDGAPNAYGPQGSKALDYLANAGHPGKWWGIETDTGKPEGSPIKQGAADPCPGFYVSSTSLVDKYYGRSNPRRYVDSTKVPYIALPKVFLNAEDWKVKIGDLAMVVPRNGTGPMSAAIFADVGPKGKLGECSVCLADRVGVPSSPKNGGTKDLFSYVLFPGSGKGQGIIPAVDEIVMKALQLFNDFGGLNQLTKVFP